MKNTNLIIGRFMGLEVEHYEAFTDAQLIDCLPEYLRYDQEWGAFMGAWIKFKGLKLRHHPDRHDHYKWVKVIGESLAINNLPPADLLAEAVEWYEGVRDSSGSEKIAEDEENYLKAMFYGSEYPAFMAALRERYELVAKTDKIGLDFAKHVFTPEELKAWADRNVYYWGINNGNKALHYESFVNFLNKPTPDQGGTKPDDPERDPLTGNGKRDWWGS